MGEWAQGWKPQNEPRTKAEEEAAGEKKRSWNLNGRVGEMSGEAAHTVLSEDLQMPSSLNGARGIEEEQLRGEIGCPWSGHGGRRSAIEKVAL